jgi:DNA-binding GntR family transcriptional regulator
MMSTEKLIDPGLARQLAHAPRRSDLAYAAIRDSISTGRIRPGDWLRQEALSDELSVSQITVRSALARLVAEGLAVHVPYKGVKVVLLPPEDLADVYELRALLEGWALELAAQRISAQDMARMRVLLPATVVDSRPESAQDAWEASREFHMLAIAASGRRHLARVLAQLLDLTNPYVLLSESSEQERLSSAVDELKDHTAIVEALEARDGRLARQRIVHHLEKTLTELRALLHDQGS